MNRTIFDITGDELALQELLTESGGDISDPAVADAVDAWFEELDKDLENKVQKYCYLIKEFEARAKTRREEAERLASRANVDDNSARSLKERLMFALNLIERPKVTTESFNIAVTRNGGATPIVIDEGAVPPEYQTVKTSSMPNRDLIRQRLEDGEQLPFAQLGDRGTHLRIR